MVENLTATQKQQIADYQRLQQSLATLLESKSQFQRDLSQVSSALEYLEKNPGKTVYKRVGVLMIQASPDDLKNELTEKKESLEKYVQRIDVQIKGVQKKMKKIEEDLKASMTPSAG